ncbi:MAG: hypothetical protein P4M14_10670 [Gammaproteobacteria bacterium]|nr:hypothetical protein [Gammaproteobacteria bacterium]
MSFRNIFSCFFKNTEKQEAKVAQEPSAPSSSSVPNWVLPSEEQEAKSAQPSGDQAKPNCMLDSLVTPAINYVSRFYPFPGASLPNLNSPTIQDLVPVLNAAFNGTCVNNKLIEGISNRGIKTSRLYTTISEAALACEANNLDYAFMEFRIPRHLLISDIIKLSIEDIVSFRQSNGDIVKHPGRETLTGKWIAENGTRSISYRP